MGFRSSVLTAPGLVHHEISLPGSCWRLSLRLQLDQDHLGRESHWNHPVSIPRVGLKPDSLLGLAARLSPPSHPLPALVFLENDATGRGSLGRACSVRKPAVLTQAWIVRENGLTIHFRTPSRPVEKQNRAVAWIQISEKKNMNNGKCSRGLLFERNAPFRSDLQLKFSIAVGEAEKQVFNF